jgi:hypothetical protein
MDPTLGIYKEINNEIEDKSSFKKMKRSETIKINNKNKAIKQKPEIKQKIKQKSEIKQKLKSKIEIRIRKKKNDNAIIYIFPI